MAPQINPVDKYSSTRESKHQNDPMLECSNNDPRSFNPIPVNKVNKGKDRDYRNHNFGIWSETEEYEGSCELDPDEATENAGNLIHLLED